MNKPFTKETPISSYIHLNDKTVASVNISQKNTRIRTSNTRNATKETTAPTRGEARMSFLQRKFLCRYYRNFWSLLTVHFRGLPWYCRKAVPVTLFAFCFRLRLHDNYRHECIFPFTYILVFIYVININFLTELQRALLEQLLFL